MKNLIIIAFMFVGFTTQAREELPGKISTIVVLTRETPDEIYKRLIYIIGTQGLTVVNEHTEMSYIVTQNIINDVHKNVTYIHRMTTLIEIKNGITQITFKTEWAEYGGEVGSLQASSRGQNIGWQRATFKGKYPKLALTVTNGVANKLPSVAINYY